ncbi:MAG: hypothetical protein EA378_10230 [Phycisphaerales bacterium]|nr:MAG: hypothetical protein EA378_10230 [Phycisphaerales bacterium]
MGLGRLGSISVLRQSGLPIGIDFGVSSLKVLQVSAGEPQGLVAAASVPTPDDLLFDDDKRFEFQFAALPKLIKQGGFKGKRAVCSIPASRTFCKHAQFQVTDGVNVGALVRALLPREIGCSPDALVFRHVEVGPCERAGGKLETICLATGREFVEQMMGSLRASKLEPVGMHSEFQAGLRAFGGFKGAGEADDGTGTLYLDIGTGSTKVLISHGTQLAFARCVEIGGAHLDQAVADQLKLAMVHAREHRLGMEQLTPEGAGPTPGPVVNDAGADEDGSSMAVLAAGMAKAGAGESPEGEDASRRQPAGAFVRSPAAAEPGSKGFRKRVAPKADLSEPLEILTDEVSMCLRYHASLFPSRRVSRVVFFGGESRQRALCHHVARTLRLSGQIADPLARVGRSGKEPTSGVSFQETQPGWAVALGLCVSPTDL